ncbi:MAG: glycosyltransferase [Rikenellaceae bacterium]
MSKNKKITFVTVFHPYRGGIASFNERLVVAFKKLKVDVKVINFSLQYPSFLFPGKTQYTDAPAPEGVEVTREVNSVNPFTWIKVGLKLKKEAPDLVFMRYWTPYLAPALSVIARIARLNKKTKVTALVDNMIAHEPKAWHIPLARYFAKSCDNFVCMSEEVRQDIAKFSNKDVAVTPHPLYDGYGETVSREVALESLKLDAASNYALFFGLIREYKGLDVLIEAWAKYKADNKDSNTKLIIAGEYYCDSAPYDMLMRELGVEESIIKMNWFLANAEVRDLFCGCDLVIQPYKSATQSGVTQVAYNYNTPMIVTNVGGLPEIVKDNYVGYVTNVDSAEVAEKISLLFDKEKNDSFKANIEQEKKRFAWSRMCEIILSLK